MKRILLRADDLGYSRAVNYGIYDSIHNGIINNVGVMVNMPSTQMGIDLLKDEDIDYGMHTNITNGKPVLSAEEVPSLVDENGNFNRSKIYRENYGKPDIINLDEVTAEIDAQYHRFLDLIGRKPDYFEGHAVMSDNFIKGLHIVADRYDLPILDFSFDGSPLNFKNNTEFNVFMESMRPNYDPYKILEEMIKHSEDEQIPMMVCHPGYLDQYILNTSSLTIPRTQEVSMAIDPKVAELIRTNDIHLLKYSECK
ncbi:putative glycoside hydrolase/deacetylase ChbG (UPF0249 family) [Lactobacillus colini]|uniref:Glycoside hydrolase/deacetylase ChbG (UPF0249 family) n=1 Tax=Lactobacillus colini TaxID=1819254 RepID=A0ABS4MEW3_9LACO|nr:ChbG/HpnK family deacetylase [Lactobacillus colini]MBP2058227.1 putative glycoside hydrolase/deacetylase ChbG (UPF0249 family) [Lactobacillus colini]